MMEIIKSYDHLEGRLGSSGKSLLFFYKNGSEQSNCALKNLLEASEKIDSLNIFTIDVKEVTDIHSRYGVNSVPSLVLVESGSLLGIIKGCHDPAFYQRLASGEGLRVTLQSGSEKPAKRVTVYSTPTCSWCNTLKTWLNKNNVRYTDIDISADQRAAEELVRRSGQQGVPQTDINGKIVVGFDQNKLKELLEIR